MQATNANNVVCVVFIFFNFLCHMLHSSAHHKGQTATKSKMLIKSEICLKLIVEIVSLLEFSTIPNSI